MRNSANKDTQVVLESAERTATVSTVMTTPCASGVFIINVTAASATPSVVFTIAGVDPASDTAYTILESAAITGAGTTVLRVGPDLTAAANTIAKDFLPEAVKVTATHADTDPITYSVGFIGVE